MPKPKPKSLKYMLCRVLYQLSPNTLRSLKEKRKQQFSCAEKLESFACFACFACYCIKFSFVPYLLVRGSVVEVLMGAVVNGRLVFEAVVTSGDDLSEDLVGGMIV